MIRSLFVQTEFSSSPEHIYRKRLNVSCSSREDLISSSTSKSTPPPFSCVLPGLLYIGNDSITENNLREQNITCIIDCRNQREQESRGVLSVPHRLNLFLNDHLNEDSASHFYSAIECIEHAKAKNETVLVLCKRGISRSSTLVCAYLIWSKQLGYREALSSLTSFHRIASPNASFSFQLFDFAERRKQPLVCFHVVKEGTALLGPLNRDAAREVFKDLHGVLVLVDKEKKVQYVWSNNANWDNKASELVVALKEAPPDVAFVTNCSALTFSKTLDLLSS